MCSVSVTPGVGVTPAVGVTPGPHLCHLDDSPPQATVDGDGGMVDGVMVDGVMVAGGSVRAVSVTPAVGVTVVAGPLTFALSVIAGGPFRQPFLCQQAS